MSRESVMKEVANVVSVSEGISFATSEIVETEIKTIKAKNRADSLEAKLEILRLKYPPAGKLELAEAEVKAVKARQNANRLEAKLKLLKLGQPIKKVTKPQTVVAPYKKIVAPSPKPIPAPQIIYEEPEETYYPEPQVLTIKKEEARMKEVEERLQDQDTKLGQMMGILHNIGSRDVQVVEDIQNERLRDEHRDLKSEISKQRDEMSDVKAALHSLINHNNSFNMGKIMGKLDSNQQQVQPQFPQQPQQPIIVNSPPQQMQQQPPIIVQSAPQHLPQQQQPIIINSPPQQMQQQPPIIVQSSPHHMPQQQPIIVQAPAHPVHQPYIQQAPAYVTPQGQPVSVEIHNTNPANPAQAIAPQPTVAVAQPQPIQSTPVAVAPQPVAPPPAPAPATPAAAENPMQKMLAGMADRLNAMNSKLDE